MVGVWAWESLAQPEPEGAAEPAQGAAQDAAADRAAEDVFEPVAGVEYDAATDRLKVSVAEESLRRVMDTVAHGAELEITVFDAAEGELTAEFDFLPLEEALTELLVDRNYVFTRTEDGSRLATVQVLSHAGEAPDLPMPAPVERPSAGEAQPTPPTETPAEPVPPDQRPVVPPQALKFLVTEKMMDDIMGMLAREQEANGLDVRAKLLEMRGQVDSDFDPDLDGLDLSDRELLQSVLEKAVQASQGDSPLGAPGTTR